MFQKAGESDAAAVADLRTAAARDLTTRFGRGHWSSEPTQRGVMSGMRGAEIWVGKRAGVPVATFRVTTRKPWAIDPTYFVSCERPIYLTDMAVDPRAQRRGIGSRCIEEILRIARDWPSDSLRLDAYDAEAGAGRFYERCGFRHVASVAYRGVALRYYERDVGEATS